MKIIPQIDKPDRSEDIFELIGLDSFFNSESDKNVNWEEFFQVKDKTANDK